MNEHTKPPMSNRTHGTSSQPVVKGGQYIEEDISLNQVFQSGLKKHATEQQKTLSIVRSDKLPSVCGRREQFQQLLDMMIEMIISYPPSGSKLFLYVKCEAEERNPEILDLRLTEGSQMHTLYFYTNITTDDRWKMICKDRLAECAVIAEQNKARFSFYPISNTGCIFSLALPGKIN